MMATSHPSFFLFLNRVEASSTANLSALCLIITVQWKSSTAKWAASMSLCMSAKWAASMTLIIYNGKRLSHSRSTEQESHNGVALLSSVRGKVVKSCESCGARGSGLSHVQAPGAYARQFVALMASVLPRRTWPRCPTRSRRTRCRSAPRPATRTRSRRTWRC